MVLHKGDEVAFGEEEGHFFVLYSENIRKRVKTHDLEETIFHESIHATLEKDHAKSQKWLEAQKKDGDFITKLPGDFPSRRISQCPLFSHTQY